MKSLYLFLILTAGFAVGLEPRVLVKPESYDIYIQTSEKDYMDNEGEVRFTGKVSIQLQFSNPNNVGFYFSLNVVNETKITNVLLQGVRGDEIENITNGISFVKEGSFLNITCKNLETNWYNDFIVHINFSNPYRKDMTGFYRSYYESKDGKKRWLVTTHFEPLSARSAFPCIDVPSLKAYFSLKIAYPKSLYGYYALFNTPLKKIVELGDLKVAEFEKTSFPMSTYLVAFVVSDFAQTEAVKFESKYPAGFPTSRNLTTHGRPDRINAGHGHFSLLIGKAAIHLLNEYLEKGYAFEKVDFIGIPDFRAGAMENWGLITYRERVLFYNEKKGTAALKQGNSLTITHELVHQWFGNLVTLASWNYIWLNEAFATYLSHVIASQIKDPNTADWAYMKKFQFDEMHSAAFEIDGSAAALPLSKNFEDENAAAAGFDDISYAKGACVLRMWDLSLSKDKFRQSLVHYIHQNEKKNVVPEHLYASFKEVANMSEDFFMTWTKRPGYPVVNVNKSGTIYTLSQSRFYWETPNNTTPSATYVIPITYTEANSIADFSTVPNIWLRFEDVELNITSKWFVINNQQAGYYRVNYNVENWLALAEALNQSKHSNIHELNRAQIINDAYSLARSVHQDYLDYGVALAITRYLKSETSYFVWRSAFNAFDFLLAKFSQEEEISDKLKAYVLDLVKPHFKPLNSTSEHHLDRLMLAQMSRWSCKLNYKPCVESARGLYVSASNYPDVEETVLCTAVESDNKAWHEIFEQYKKETHSSRKTMYLSVLSCTNKVDTIEYLLNLTLSKEDTIRKQDRPAVFSSIVRRGGQNVDIAFKFAENNYKTIATEYGGTNALGKAIVSLAKKLHTKECMERMEKLTKKIKENPELNVPPESINNALSIVKNNEEWIRKKAKQLEKQLSSASRNSTGILLLLCTLIFLNY